MNLTPVPPSPLILASRAPRWSPAEEQSVHAFYLDNIRANVSTTGGPFNAAFEWELYRGRHERNFRISRSVIAMKAKASQLANPRDNDDEEELDEPVTISLADMREVHAEYKVLKKALADAQASTTRIEELLSLYEYAAVALDGTFATAI